MLTVKRLRDQTGYLYKATAQLADAYGPIIGLKVGKDKQVVCYGYKAIKEMLTKEELDGRPRGPFYETRTWGQRRGDYSLEIRRCRKFGRFKRISFLQDYY